MTRRLSTDFTHAWNSTGKALEDITILGLSLILVGTYGMVWIVRNTRTWIQENRNWMVPGKGA